MDKLEEHLQKLAEFDLTFTKKDQNLYLLNYHGLSFKLIRKDKELYLKVPVTPCPEKQREELFSLLMQANLLGEGTYGNVLGLEPEEKYLTLTGYLPYEITYKALKEKLEHFFGAKELWEQEVKAFLSKANK